MTFISARLALGSLTPGSLTLGSVVLGSLTGLLALAAFPGVALAQPDPVPTADARIVPAVSGGVLAALVQIRTSTGDDDLGTATLRIDFNDAALDPASGTASGAFLVAGTDFAYANFTTATNPAYGAATVSYPLAGRIHVNIELNTDHAGTLVARAPAWTDIVTIRFAITDDEATAGLVFRPGGVAQNGQELYDGDNATEWIVGALAGNDDVLPVELMGFEAASDAGGVALRWQTASETNNAGFHVEHRTADAPWAEAGFVAGAGTTAEARAYEHRVARVEPGRHVFRLRQVDLDGAAHYSAEVEARVAMLEPFRFGMAGPNPFAGRTALSIAAREAQRVRVEAFDALGRRVAILFDGRLEASRAERIPFDAMALPAGLYVVRATGERFTATRALTRAR